MLGGFAMCPSKPAADARCSVLGPGVPGERHEVGRSERRVGSERPGDLIAVHPGEPDVAEDHVGRECPGLLNAIGAGVGHVDVVAGQLEHVPEAVGRIPVVLDDEDSTRRGAVRRGAARFGRRGGLEFHRHPDRELCALPRAVAADRGSPAVKFGHALHERQSEPEAALAAFQGTVGLHERFENPVQEFGMHPDPRVTDEDGAHRSRGIDLQLQDDAPPG